MCSKGSFVLVTHRKAISFLSVFRVDNSLPMRALGPGFEIKFSCSTVRGYS